MSAPVKDEDLGQERSICQDKDDESKFITVIRVEDPQAAEHAFTTYEQPYTFVSEKWVLVGELAVLEEAANKLGTEVRGKPGEGETPRPVESEPSGEPLETYALGEPFRYSAASRGGPAAEWD